MEFSRQEYRSGLPFPSPGDLPNPGIEPGSPTLQADALLSEPSGKLYGIFKYKVLDLLPYGAFINISLVDLLKKMCAIALIRKLYFVHPTVKMLHSSLVGWEKYLKRYFSDFLSDL